jgi:hypothetical protein
MAQLPAKTINFDGSGLADDDTYVEDANGVGHFHEVQAGSTWRFRLQFSGKDTTSLSWEMEVRESLTSSDELLTTNGSGDTLITVTTGAGSNDEIVEFSVSSSATAAAFQPMDSVRSSFVYDIFVVESGDRAKWVVGSGTVIGAVSR